MSAPVSECIIFAGPTLRDLNSDCDYQSLPIEWRPPARRGDIEALMEARPPGKLAIVDGLFHQCPAVGHAELRIALEQGWQIWGLSSMGAIRAYEMRDLGLRGFGQVYQYFLSEDDFRDDEVTLLHEPAPSYRPRSEPLIHIRVALKALCQRDLISESAANQIIATLAAEWYGERTLARLQKLVIAEVGEAATAEIKQWLAEFGKYRIKSQDLADFLTQRIWHNEQTA